MNKKIKDQIEVGKYISKLENKVKRLMETNSKLRNQNSYYRLRVKKLTRK